MGGQTYEYSDMPIIEYIYTQTLMHTNKKKQYTGEREREKKCT